MRCFDRGHFYVIVTQQSSQEVGKYASALVVSHLGRRVNSQLNGDLFSLSTGTMDGEGQRLTRDDAVLESREIKSLTAVDLQDSAVHVLDELTGKHTHLHEIATVNSFEAAGDHRPHAQQRRTFGRPVTRAAGSVIFTGHHDQGYSLTLVPHRSIKDVYRF